MRRPSYINLHEPLIGADEIDEECASGDSGSTKNAKRVHQDFLAVPNPGHIRSNS